MAGIGQVLRHELDHRQLSQNQAAKQIGVPQSAVSRWVLEEGMPNLESCTKLAAWLGRSLREVLDLARPEIPDQRPELVDPAWVSLDQEMRSILEPIERELWPLVVQAARLQAQVIQSVRAMFRQNAEPTPANVRQFTLGSDRGSGAGQHPGKVTDGNRDDGRYNVKKKSAFLRLVG